MSRGINKVILVGNLKQDPEIRYLSNGNVVANFSCATVIGEKPVSQQLALIVQPLKAKTVAYAYTKIDGVT